MERPGRIAGTHAIPTEAGSSATWQSTQKAFAPPGRLPGRALQPEASMAQEATNNGRDNKPAAPLSSIPIVSSRSFGNSADDAATKEADKDARVRQGSPKTNCRTPNGGPPAGKTLSFAPEVVKADEEKETRKPEHMVIPEASHGGNKMYKRHKTIDQSMPDDMLKAIRNSGEFKVGDSETSDDSELEEEPPQSTKTGRRNAVSAQATGEFNKRRAAYQPPLVPKLPEHSEAILDALKECCLFQNMDLDALEAIRDAMPVETIMAGLPIVVQGDEGTTAYVVLDGEAEVWRENPRNAGIKGAGGKLLTTMSGGRLFGELAMIWARPRQVSVYAKTACTLGKLERLTYNTLVTGREMKDREVRDSCLRKVKILETLNDEQLASIGDAMQKREYKAGENIITQGEEGDEFFVLIKGEAVAQVTTGDNDVQEHRRYYTGDLFGERALLCKQLRAATVKACTACQAVCLSRAQFARLLGPLDQLHKMNYATDPRKNIADFYRPGDVRGPAGALPQDGSKVGAESQWFAVYRPTSRDAIAKMLNGVAVGKGLNVKGKSAKKNRLSGFVPFLQISDNEHKYKIEASSPKARLTVFYTTKVARDTALGNLQPILEENLDIQSNKALEMVDDYSGIYGLNMPEPVMREAYIMRQDISFLAGWETGRQSEPAFMDMNLHAVIGSSKPTVVLYQIDESNPMNPQGLLIAYAEATVKPVVSDFDTFTVGSRGVSYRPLIENQVKLAEWSLDRTADVLRNPQDVGWNSRWLQVIRKATEEGFHPDLPEFGFGDDTSYELIANVVAATKESGAVRHGAECFNFFFPQELDETYLCVWEGFEASGGKPWEYLSEAEMRKFLLDRCEEGYVFPVNPVWAVRDPGWLEVFHTLLKTEEAKRIAKAWYPHSIMERVIKVSKEFPDGFHLLKESVEEMSKTQRQQHVSMMNDLECCEGMDIAMQVARRSHWSTVRIWFRARAALASLRRHVHDHDHDHVPTHVRLAH